MNPLEQLIHQHALNEVQAMSLLQDHGIVSDCCVWAEDVADSDALVACAWLRERLDL